MSRVAPKIILNTRPGPGRIWLWPLGIASTAIWVWVALAMPTSNRPLDVGIFLGAMAVLFALYFLALGRVRRAAAGARLTGTVVVFAVVLRLVAVLAGLPASSPLAALRADVGGQRVAYQPFLLYDNDLWRYLWDGHVLAQGSNPYLVRPEAALEDPVLEDRLLATESWRDVHDAVSFRDYATIYPPLVHHFFALLARVAPASAGAAKLALATADLLLCALLWHALGLAGVRRELVLAYAWNPAVIKEISGSGHPDVLMMLLLTAGALLLARGSTLSGGAAVVASLLAKLGSAVALPLVALFTWTRWRAAGFGRAVVGGGLVATLGFLALEGGLSEWWSALEVFAERWTFNSGPWAAVRWTLAGFGVSDPAIWAHWLTRAVILVVALAAAVVFGVGVGARSRLVDPRTAATESVRALFSGLFVTLAALVLLAPAVMPWYVLWALPAATVLENRWWPIFTGLALLSYLNYADGVGAAVWWKWIEYGGLAVCVAWVTAAGSSRKGWGEWRAQTSDW